MTLEKVFFVLMKGVSFLFDALEQCVISINGSVDITLTELFIGTAAAVFVVWCVKNFTFRS